MSEIYCAEGQIKASLILNIYNRETQIDFDNPPIAVSFEQGDNGYLEVYQRPGLTPIEPYASVSLFEPLLQGDRIRIEINVEGFVGWILYIDNDIPELQDGRITTFELPSVQELPFPGNPVDAYIINYQAPSPKLKVIDKNGVEFASDFPSGSTYKINCDGCEPGNCRGNREKYPGYVCFDCKKMQSQIFNMENKLND